MDPEVREQALGQATNYHLDSEDGEVLHPGQEEELHFVEAAIEELQGPGGDPMAGEETAEILVTMLAQKKKTFTQSVRLKKAKELARGYSDWRGKGYASSSGSTKGRGKN